EVGEDLLTDAVVALVDWKPEVLVCLDGVEALVLQRVGAELVHQPDAPTLLPQVEDDSPPRLGDDLHRLVQLGAAVAPLGGEDVAGEALAVGAEQHRLAVADVAEGQRDVGLPGDQVVVAVRGEDAERCRQTGAGAAYHQLLAAVAVGSQPFDDAAEHAITYSTRSPSGRALRWRPRRRVAATQPRGGRPRSRRPPPGTRFRR